jgi:hypothetical protein
VPKPRAKPRKKKGPKVTPASVAATDRAKELRKAGISFKAVYRQLRKEFPSLDLTFDAVRDRIRGKKNRG